MLHLLVLMEGIDKKKYDTKKNRRDTHRVGKLHFRFLKVRNINKIPEGNTVGWFPEEKFILECLVIKFGCGCYTGYLSSNALPYRSKQQMSTQLQRMLDLQAIGLFHGLKFRMEDAREFLSTHFGIKSFHKSLPGSFNTALEKEHILQLFIREVEQDPDPDVVIPYFRRLDDFKHLQLLIKDSGDEQAKDFMLKNNIDSVQQLEDLLGIFTKDVSEIIEQNEKLLDNVYGIIQANPEISTTLNTHYSVTTLPFDSDADTMDTHDLSTRFQAHSGTLTISFQESKIKVAYVNVDTQDKLILLYLGGNQFKIDGSDGLVYFEPSCKMIYITDVFDLIFYNPRSKKSIFQLIVMYPPWEVGSKNPTRGVTLSYPTISLKRFSQLKLPLLNYPFGSHLYIWVTNHSYHCVLNWAMKENFYLIECLTWIKYTRNGNIFKTLGHYLQHAQETCLIFERRCSPELSYADTFNEITKHKYRSTIRTYTCTPLMKPEFFYTMLDELYPYANKIDIFSRCNNVRYNWTAVGLDLQPKKHLSYLSSNRREAF
eukprot:snap_masked-scaffold_81-processed-gene-0.30-mRNA-1 protein AED:1.00 eAED:1.00 QI:0/-1/0/0/-1/1/1/0/540